MDQKSKQHLTRTWQSIINHFHHFHFFSLSTISPTLYSMITSSTISSLNSQKKFVYFFPLQIKLNLSLKAIFINLLMPLWVWREFSVCFSNVIICGKVITHTDSTTCKSLISLFFSGSKSWFQRKKKETFWNKSACILYWVPLSMH